MELSFCFTTSEPQGKSPFGETTCPVPLTFSQQRALKRQASEIKNGVVPLPLRLGGAMGLGGFGAGWTAGALYGVKAAKHHADAFRTAKYIADSDRLLLQIMSLSEGSATAFSFGSAAGAAGGVGGLALGLLIEAANPWIDLAFGSERDPSLLQAEFDWLDKNCPK